MPLCTQGKDKHRWAGSETGMVLKDIKSLQVTFSKRSSEHPRKTTWGEEGKALCFRREVRECWTDKIHGVH